MDDVLWGSEVVRGDGERVQDSAKCRGTNLHNPSQERYMLP